MIINTIQQYCRKRVKLKENWVYLYSSWSYARFDCMYIMPLGCWLHGKISGQQTGLKKTPITWNISSPAETEIEVNPARNFSVAFVISAICILPRLSIIFSAQPEIFFVRLHGISKGPITWSGLARLAEMIFSARASQTGLKLSACNRELRFSSILPEGRAENIHVISLSVNITFKKRC